jgi:hypothetical protein
LSGWRPPQNSENFGHDATAGSPAMRDGPAHTICVIAKEDPSKSYKCWEVGNYAMRLP